VYSKEGGVGGIPFHKLVTWKDSELKCDICGESAEDGKHNHLLDATTSYLKADADYHDFKPGKNEIAYLYERLKGLVVIKHKKDCLDLPDKRYRIINCEPKPSTLRVAQALLQAAPNTITGLTWLRELSDGFQYRNKIVGKETCPVYDGTCITSYWVDPADSDKAFTMTDMLDPEYVKTLEKQDFPCASCNGTGQVDKMERIVKEVPCPKDEALINLLDENEETGRLVVFAGFTGSIDKITALCLKHE
jgi:SNF2 family DNA or RNA helicase